MVHCTRHAIVSFSFRIRSRYPGIALERRSLGNYENWQFSNGKKLYAIVFEVNRWMGMELEGKEGAAATGHWKRNTKTNCDKIKHEHCLFVSWANKQITCTGEWGRQQKTRATRKYGCNLKLFKFSHLPMEASFMGMWRETGNGKFDTYQLKVRLYLVKSSEYATENPVPLSRKYFLTNKLMLVRFFA